MGSGGKQKTQQTQTQHTVSTPNVPSWYSGLTDQLTPHIGGMIGELGNANAFTPNANQTRGWNMAGGAGGADLINQGAAGLKGVGDVNYDSLAGADLSPYMNPYTQSVIDTSLADLNRTTAENIARNQSAATASGSYGGSRHGVADSLIYGEGQRAAGSLSAGLRSDNFNQARQGAMYDINNRYTAGTDNAARRMAIASGLVGAGGALDANNRANAAQIAEMGDNERQNTGPYARARYAAMIEALMGGLNPSLFTGQTEDGTGTTTQRTSTQHGLFDYLKLIASLVPGNRNQSAGG